ncbi:MAG: hypothetical protein KDD41_06515 [Flavobacteriales bacterium]|nr:hypothetical protein [Flavobacteriales bacterium]
MKKKVLFVASLFLATAMFAQDGLTSKKGEAYLPEAGDWAIGFDANPFLQYGGQMFNGATTNSFGGATWQGNNTATMALMGKYYKDESTAYRLMFRFGMGGDNFTTIQDTSTTSLPGTGALENKTTNSNGLAFIVGGGLEKRKGNTRIQGYYGGQIMIGILGGSSSTYEYGATMDSTNVANGIIVDENGTPGSARATEMKNGGTFLIGLNGFIGVEWFIFPKVSVGAEYGWGFSMASTGEGETTTESWNFVDNRMDSYTTKTGSAGSWAFDTGVTGGNINILFHF